MKVLIVDDEPRHCRGMAAMIQSTRPHAKLLIAKDGISALATVKEERPEIIFSDIRMPNMDGVTLLSEIRKLQHKPKVIMLSAYNLFEYAQNAIRYGAYDYILKPVDIDKLEDVLTRAEAELSKEAAERQEAERMRERLSVTTSAHLKQLALDWLAGNLSAIGRRELEFAGLPIGEGTIIYSEFRPHAGARPRAACSTDELHRDLDLVWSRFGQAFGVVLSMSQLERASNNKIRIATILQTSRKLELILRMEIREALTSLEEKWRPSGRWAHAVGSKCVSLGDEAPEAYRAAREASRYLFYDRWHGVLFADELTGERPSVQLNEEALSEAIKQGDASAARDRCHTALETFAANGQTDPDLLKEFASLILSQLKNGISERFGANGVRKLTEAATRRVPVCESYSELLSIVDTGLDEAQAYWSRLKSDKRELVIDHCVALMQERYMEEMSLESMADRFHFNVSYFSTLFKQRMGKSFSDVLIEIRMKRAKELLEGGDLRIYEIAAACGYKDTKYFSRVFKKHTGLSPESFRHLPVSSPRKGDAP